MLALPGVFEYPFQQPGQALWHVNFADTQLFFAYGRCGASTVSCRCMLMEAGADPLTRGRRCCGSSLFAQDEVQVAEHPVLASVREAALASRRRATRPLTREPGAPTPILVSGADRCLSIDTARLYGHAFAAAPAATVRRCCRQLRPPTVSNILAMAAPQGAGAYSCVDLADILQTATCGFAAAAQASEGRTLVCTGHWGCGAFGGSRVAMALLQIAAARLAGVHELRYHAFDEAGAAAVHEADTLLGKIWQPGLPGAALVQRVQALGFQWGESDGT